MYINHRGIDETRLLACKSFYWISMNTDKEDTIKNCLTCLDFQMTQLKDKAKWHKILERLLKSFRTDSLSFDSKHYLCILHYHSKFQVIKLVGGFNAHNLFKRCKMISFRVQLPSKIVSDMAKGLKPSASDLAYIMQYHHHIAIKAIDRQRHAQNLSK